MKGYQNYEKVRKCLMLILFLLVQVLNSIKNTEAIICCNRSYPFITEARIFHFVFKGYKLVLEHELCHQLHLGLPWTESEDTAKKNLVQFGNLTLQMM